MIRFRRRGAQLTLGVGGLPFRAPRAIVNASLRYSVFSILKQGLAGNRGWSRAWRDPKPQPRYDVVIGGGGHGLATAYSLATKFGVRNVAVLEKGYLGSGNIGRNTTIIRSNYLLPGSNPFYELSLKLWEGLEPRNAG